ncbi:MAG: LEA type 2 family protein [Gammaproteobacteria bacterium]
MNRRLLAALVATVHLLVLAGCASLTSLEPPEVRVTDVRGMPRESSGLEQRFAVGLNVLNPNNREILVDGMDFELELNGRQLARGVSSEAFVLPALGEAGTTVTVSTSLVNVFGQLLELGRTQPDRLEYRIRGKLHLGSGMVRTIPFDRTGTLQP